MTENASQIFNHLHIHTEYSLVDGAIRIDDLLSKVAKMGHRSVAITDHGNLFGAIEFYTQAMYKNINPIIGAELYVEPHPATTACLSEIGIMPESPQAKCFQYVFLAKNLEGYHNLVRLVSSGYLCNGNTLPIVPSTKLVEYASGLICIPSFHGGELSFLHKHLSHPSVPGAIHELTQHLRRTFGDDSFYIELCSNQIPGELELQRALAATARTASLPLVASANAHYLEPSDQEAHTVLVAIKNELKLSELRDRRMNVRAHVFSNEEMQEYFREWPEALSNTLKIAEQCQLRFEFGKYFLPKISVNETESTADAMGRLSREGLEHRFVNLRKLYGPSFDEHKQNEYRKRLEYELKVIASMGFNDYFLIVQDFINWAKKQDIPVGPGRGSGAGSLVAYALRITDLDPIPYNLIFERFLNPERVSMPDFDVDFCQDRRDEVIRYVTQRYGSDQVAQITTFGKMLAKAVLRDVGRVFDVSYGKMDRISKLIPNELGIRLKDAIEREPRLKEEATNDPILADILKIALQLEGLSRHTSVHAAGIVISDGPMQNYVPVYRSEDGSLITQYEMKNAEKVGLVKFDFLGLKTLTVIKRAVDMIAKTRQLKLDIDAIPLDNRKVYQMISEAKSIGVFQLESSGMQKLLSKLKPSNFEDIIALVALFRPGPLQSGMVDDFVERKHGRQAIEYSHRSLEPILRDTYGTILYQEQVQKIAAVLANYSLGEADLLRRAMGKKKPEEMAKQKSRFVEGCRANQIAEEKSSALFDLMAKFAEYGFNKSHSAAYGLVSYQTGYLKANFTAEFFAASMSCDMDNTDKIVAYAKDCREFAITILRPDINESELDFSVPKPNQIRFGLAAIKGVGRASLEALVAERTTNGAFTNLTQLAKRVNLNRLGKKTFELLVQAGALDSFKIARHILVEKTEELVRYSSSHHDAMERGQRELFAEESSDGDESDQFLNMAQLDIPDPANQDQALWLKREKALLGIYVSAHPTQFLNLDREQFCNARIRELPKLGGQSDIFVLGILYDKFERTAKDDRRFLVLRIEDDTGDMTANVLAHDFPNIETLPALESPVIAKFRVLRGFDDAPPRPRLEQLWSLDDFRRQRLRGLQFSMRTTAEPTPGADDIVAKLQKLLGEHSGRTPIEFDLRIDKTQLKLKPKGWSVDPTTNLLHSISVLTRKGAEVTVRMRT